MKSKALLLKTPLLSAALLLSGLSFAQSNYTASADSGTGGANNVFMGPSAGRITTSYNNSFVGYRAGFCNTTGAFNSFMGSGAGALNTTGSLNSFLGMDAGYANTTGSSNSFVGSYAGYSNTTGGTNSFLGSYAGYANTTGSDNSFVGYGAGSKNVVGNNNTTLGFYANVGANNLTNATALGYQAQVSASYSLVLGSIIGVNGAKASTNVGIGMTAPGYLLHVNGTAAKPGGGTWKIAKQYTVYQLIN